MAVRFLDDDARAAFRRAVEAIEAGSAAEVVVSVRRRSAGYLHASVIVGLAAGVAALAYALWGARAFSLATILVDPVVLGVAAGALARLSAPLCRALTPVARRRARVARAARALFVERGVHATTERGGLLVYVSWLEQEVALVADVALARALPDGALPAAEAALTAAFRDGGAAVARALEALAPRLAEAMPRRADDRNELPDELDDGRPGRVAAW